MAIYQNKSCNMSSRLRIIHIYSKKNLTNIFSLGLSSLKSLFNYEFKARQVVHLIL